MTNSAADYTAYLRCHVIPVRISFSELRRFPSGSSFPTLLKDNRIPFLFQRRSSTSSSSDEEFISVGGVRVTSPGLFYSRNLAVHGLAGTINCRSHQEFSPWIDHDINRTPPPLPPPPPPPINSPPNRLHVLHRHPPPPPPRANSSGEDATFLSSVPPRSPELSAGSDISLSPILSHRQSQSPSPESGRAYNHYMKSAKAGAPDFKGYSESPIDLLPHISPDSYGVFSPPPPEIITSDSSYVPPPFEFSENDDPIAFSPSDFRNFDNQDTDKQQYAESELGSLSSSNDLLISPQDYVPIISQDEKSAEETVGEYSEEIVRDCPRTDGFTKISFFPNMFCAKTPVQQPQFPSVLGVIHG